MLVELILLDVQLLLLNVIMDSTYKEESVINVM